MSITETLCKPEKSPQSQPSHSHSPSSYSSSDNPSASQQAPNPPNQGTKSSPVNPGQPLGATSTPKFGLDSKQQPIPPACSDHKEIQVHSNIYISHVIVCTILVPYRADMILIMVINYVICREG